MWNSIFATNVTCIRKDYGQLRKRSANPSFLAAKWETETSCGVLRTGSVCEEEITVAVKPSEEYLKRDLLADGPILKPQILQGLCNDTKVDVP